jgi:hypothetical protein
MSYWRGSDRLEVPLLPACLDDYVAPDSPARFIDAYAENLDFQALGFVRARPAATGRPPYPPADLVQLYLYGYLHRIRSSRRPAAIRLWPLPSPTGGKATENAPTQQTKTIDLGFFKNVGITNWFSHSLPK